MAEKENELGRFTFVVKVIRKPDGRLEYLTPTSNRNVLPEIIIMQTKSFLKNLEETYFNYFKKS